MIVDGGRGLFKVVVFSAASAVGFARAAMTEGDRVLVDEVDEEATDDVDLSALVVALHLDETRDAFCFAMNGAGAVSAESATVALTVNDADAFVVDLPPPVAGADVLARFVRHIRHNADRLAAARPSDCPIVVRATPDDARTLEASLVPSDTPALAAPVFVDTKTAERDVVRIAVERAAKPA